MHLSPLGLMTLEHSTPLGLMTLEHSRTVTHTYKLPYLHALGDCLFIQVTHYTSLYSFYVHAHETTPTSG